VTPGFLVVAAERVWVQIEAIPAVMAGLVPAIHVFARAAKNVDARDKPGHDDLS
jgi:hypothetical protein